jgi:hypothetical protein
MIPKDSYSTLYIGIYKLKRKRSSDCPRQAGGASGLTKRTICGSPHRLYTQVAGAWGATRCSGGNFGPSAPRCRTIRAHRGLSAGALRTVHAQVGLGLRVVSQAGSPFLLKPDHSLIFLSLSLSLSCSLSLKKGTPPWGFGLGHSPDRPSTSTDSLRGSPPCHPSIF